VRAGKEEVRLLPIILQHTSRERELTPVHLRTPAKPRLVLSEIERSEARRIFHNSLAPLPKPGMLQTPLDTERVCEHRRAQRQPDRDAFRRWM